MDKRRARVLPLAAAAAVLLLMRIPFLRVNEVALFVAKAALAMLMAEQCLMEGKFYPAAQAVGLALLAWLIDLNEGAMAFVYGGAGIAMAWAYRRFAPLGALPKALLGALLCCLATCLGHTLVLTLGRAQTTPGAALAYALTRQIAPFFAYLAGGLLDGWLRRRPAAA